MSEHSNMETLEPEESVRTAKRKKRKIVNGILIGIAVLIMVVIPLGSRIYCWAYGVLHPNDHMRHKPVIYLYPQQAAEVSVSLDTELSVTYPEYNGGWEVTAYPDGTLYTADGREYSYLFWEGISDTEWDFSEGFCIKGEDTAEFLREALSEQGLTPREYNEFIVYWLPLMQDNKYNVISFQGENYELSAPLKITPQPDVIKRVFMAYYPSDSEVEIPPQTLSGFDRSGFAAVEWGGAEVSPG